MITKGTKQAFSKISQKWYEYHIIYVMVKQIIRNNHLLSGNDPRMTHGLKSGNEWHGDIVVQNWSFMSMISSSLFLDKYVHYIITIMPYKYKRFFVGTL
jgi:hypothetical protein